MYSNCHYRNVHYYFAEEQLFVLQASKIKEIYYFNGVFDVNIHKRVYLCSWEANTVYYLQFTVYGLLFTV